MSKGKRIMIVGGIWPVIVAATACGGRTSPTAPGGTVRTISATKFLAFGDSLTEGKLADGSTPAGADYPTQAQNRLRERYTAQTITVIGAGHGGERAADSLDRYSAALAQHEPQAVMILHGVNDVNGGAGYVMPAVSSVLAMVNMAQARGAVVFVATIPPFSEGRRAWGREHVATFNDALRAALVGSGATLVDIHARWNTTWMGDDGIHPTAEGYAAIAQMFTDAASATLETRQ